MMHRRNFLAAGLGAGASLGWMGPAFGARKDNVLVRVFLRGGLDGLNAVVPFADDAYYAARPTIAVPRPQAEGGALPLDERFGLHPSLRSLIPLYRERSLALVQAVGSPAPTRSHFDAQDNMEAGSLEGYARAGWLGRVRRQLGEGEFAAVAMQDALPLALGGGEAIALGRLDKFGFAGGEKARSRWERGFAALYAGGDGLVSPAGRRALSAVARVRALAPENYRPAEGVDYGKGAAATQLRDLAMLIKGKVGVRVATVDVGGWDTHTGESARLERELHRLGTAISAFHRDLGDRMANVLVLVVSEFGRTVEENGSGGTDHGHGTMMMMLGGPVKGGRVYGRWPGLSKPERYQGRDLDVTTDFRVIFGEVLEKQLGVSKASAALFGQQKAPSPLGFLR